jgi:hypothetical protein
MFTHATVWSLVVASLAHPRAVAAAATAIALVASVLLGTGDAAAGWSTSPGGR